MSRKLVHNKNIKPQNNRVCDIRFQFLLTMHQGRKDEKNLSLSAAETTNMIRIQRALISVSDKAGIVAFAAALHDQKVEILSTGGTARLLADNGIPVIEVSNYTGFPEMMDGRVKTLHPRIHGGILARRDRNEF